MQNVDRGIMISVDHQAAFRTPMHTNTQFFRNQRSAVRADLAGVTRIDCNHLRTGAFSLEREMSQQLGPTCIMNAFSKFGTAETVDIKIFNGDQRELVDQSPTELVGKVFPLVGDSPVGLGHLLPGPVPTERELLTSGEAALLSAELLLGLSEVAGGFDQLSGRKGDQGGHAQVNAYRFTRMCFRLGIRDFKLEGGEPLSQAIASDDRGLDLGIFRDRAVKEGPNLSHSLNAKAISFEACPIPKAKLQRAKAGTGFESGKAGLLPSLDTAKECREGFLQPTKDLLAGREVKLAQAIGVGYTDLLELVGLGDIVKRDPYHQPGFSSLFEGSIIKLSGLLKEIVQGLGLGFLRIEAVLV